MLLALVGAVLSLGTSPSAQTTKDLRVGHWIEARGHLDDAGRFVAAKIEVTEPQRYEVLIGTARAHAAQDRFVLLGQPVSFSDRTDWSRVEADAVEGTRVKVEGRWRGPFKFSARKVSPRGAGRDRIGGRIDALSRKGGELVARVMCFEVVLPEDVEVEAEGPLASLALAPARIVRPETDLDADEDDLFGRGIALGSNLVLSGQFELKSRYEAEYDLAPARKRDRTDVEGSARLRLDWRPSDEVLARVEVRSRYRWRDEQDKGQERVDDTRLGETFLYLEDGLTEGWDLYIGRQDFDEAREWIYDQNLDALRVVRERPGSRLELSLSTTLSDGSPRDEDSLNVTGYLSNGDDRRHLAVWSMVRDIDSAQEEDLFWLGARALGEWLPENDVWLELAAIDGDRDGTDVNGVALDAGTTWSPEWSGPLSFTVGYAYGSGDSHPDRGGDGTFRQTGFQDNNAKFAGVTSFRYYGELARPELSNIGIATLGVGIRLAGRTSLDLVAHDYVQDEALDEFLGADLKAKPTGFRRHLGFEVDAILGIRRSERFDVELVGAWFQPGNAFDKDQDAFLATIQLRYRL
ncbi:MAG TPA: hypothetical protein ENJ09_03800 [Planctomycetes bacterium]|nr:hypothetical protein [Planctomycetota bacterium]